MNKLLSFINLGAHWKMRKTMEMCRTQLIILTRIPCADIFEFIYNLLVITYKLWVQTGQKCYSNSDSGKEILFCKNYLAEN